MVLFYSWGKIDCIPLVLSLKGGRVWSVCHLFAPSPLFTDEILGWWWWWWCLQTSASLKFTVLNPKGRIWTMVAGGGASVIYADTVCSLWMTKWTFWSIELFSTILRLYLRYCPFFKVGDLGYASELGNYAEYSGAPNEEEVLQYARVVIDVRQLPSFSVLNL